MINLPSRGPLSILSVEVERELTEKDLLELQFMPGNSPPPVQKMSARHRRTAMMVAQGKSDILIADALGYTPVRVRQLKQDPGFQLLVRMFEDQIHEETLNDEKRFQEKLRAAGEAALDELNDRLDDPIKREQMSDGRLVNIIIVSADRTVAPPKQIANTPNVPANITLNFGTTLKPKPKTISETGEELEELKPDDSSS